MPAALPSRILFVADAAHAADLPGLAARAASAGIRFIEIRRSAAHPLGSAQRLREILAARGSAPGATLLVNDRVDLAVLAGESGADGAHVGQDDLPPAAARALLGTRLLGLSTHDEEQARRAAGMPVDYVAIGPVFASRTKSGHAEPLGLEGVRAARRACRLPLVAIGGIDASNAASVLDAGADCIAVASAIALGDVEAEARRLLVLAGEA